MWLDHHPLQKLATILISYLAAARNREGIIWADTLAVWTKGDRGRWKEGKLSDLGIPQHRTTELSGCTHAFFFKKREEWPQRWFGDHQSCLECTGGWGAKVVSSTEGEATFSLSVAQAARLPCCRGGALQGHLSKAVGILLLPWLAWKAEHPKESYSWALKSNELILLHFRLT